MTRSKAAILAGALLALVLVGCLLVGTTKASPAALQSRSCSFTLPGVPVSDSTWLGSDQPLLGAASFSDGFESGISQWTRTGSPTWARTSYRAASGSYSAFCVGSTVTPPNHYPNGADSLMLAGPFDLSQVGTAVLEYDLWLKTEVEWDYCFAVASLDGVNIDGYGFSGDSEGWVHEGLDLSAVPGEYGDINMVGDTSVWVGFWFASDPVDGRDDGAFVDNVQLVTTEAPPTGPPTITGLNPNFGSTAGGKTVVITGTNLTGAIGVTFGGTPASGYTVNGLTQITATAPGHATAEAVDVQVTTPLGASDNTVADDFTYMPPVTYSSYRGSDRYDTAIRIAKALFPAPLPAGSGLVVAPGETFPEALCGAPLASAWGGPVLLTYKTALANNVKTELQRLAPTNVFCVGLTTTAVGQVQTALPGAAVTAITGADVYAMSRNVANALEAKVGDMTAATAIVTIGTNFPDAIGVSPLACANLWPILLTQYGDNRALHASAAGAVADLGITKALKVGTYASLPTGVVGVGNCSGVDRYVTDANVAAWGKTSGGLAFTHTGIATGDKFPDALASGPYLAQDDGILLLSPLNGPLPPAISALITANGAGIQDFTFIAMIEPVIGQVKALLP